MRDYALTLAHPTLSNALIPKAIRCLKSALIRRRIREALQGKAVSALAGPTASDLRRLLALPLSCDLTLEIERITFLASLEWPVKAESAAATCENDDDSRAEDFARGHGAQQHIALTHARADFALPL